LKVATETGLLAAVLIPHPKGLQQEITEGGVGLSGGQRQLVNLTRVFLRKPKIWLLDEPTASMDSMHEQHILGTLKNNLAPDHTLILVTHKPAAFALVDRLIIISNQQIVLDGPKELVLQKLMAHQQNLQQVKV